MSSSQGGSRIWIVEDDPDQGELYVHWLSGAHEVRLLESGEALFAALDDDSPDLILLDLELTGMHGFEVLAALPAGDRAEGPAILVLTARVDDGTLSRCLDAGADDFVGKPVGRIALEARAAAQLRALELTRSLHRALRAREADLQLTARAQRGFLMRDPPVLHGLECVRVLRPFDQVSGDFVDVIPGTDGSTLAILADVAGHGVSAGLFTTFLKAEVGGVLARAGAEVGPGELLGELNRAFMRSFEETVCLISAVCAQLDPAGSRWRLASAGHPPAYVLARSGEVSVSGAGGMLLGLHPEATYEEEQIPAHRGQRLVLYSDGVVEELGGEQRRREDGDRAMREELERAAELPLTELVDRLLPGQDSSPLDDLTVLAFEVGGAREAP